MRINGNESLKPTEDKSKALAASGTKVIENIQNQINELGTQLTQLQDALSGLGTSVSTVNVNASGSVTAPTGTFDRVSVNDTLATDKVNAGEVTSDKDTTDDLHALNANIDTLEAENAEIETLKVRDLEVERYQNMGDVSIDNAEISNITGTKADIGTVNSNKVDSQLVKAATLKVTGNSNLENVSAKDVSADNVTVTGALSGEEVSAKDGDIETLLSKSVNSVEFLHDSHTSNIIVIDQDSFIKVSGKQNETVLLRLKDGNDIDVMSAEIVFNETTSGKFNSAIRLNNESAVNKIYIDKDGDLWIQLGTGITGRLYFMLFGMDAAIPETYSQENTPFDISQATMYNVQTKKTWTLISDSEKIEVSSKDLEFTGNAIFNGNVFIRGKTTISGFESERAKFLGESDDVTADDEGNFSANSITSVGDAAIGGDATVTGSLDVADGITGNLTGDVTGNVTGDVTGNLTGNVTGDVDGTATNATNDGDGNEITETYATKSEIGNMVTTDTEQEIIGEKDFFEPPVISGLLDDTPVDAGENVVCFDEDGKLIAGKIVSDDPYSGFFKVTNLDEFKAALENAESKPILIMNSFSWSYTQGQTVAAGRTSVSIYDISYFDKNKTQKTITGSDVFITGLSTLYLYGARMTGIGFATSGVGNTSVTLYSAYFSSPRFYRIYNAVDSTIQMDGSSDAIANKIILNAIDCTITAQIKQSISDPGLKINRMKGGTLNIKWKYSYSSVFDADYGYTEIVESLENVTVNVTADYDARYARIPYYFYCRDSDEAFINCNFTFTFSNTFVYFPGALFKFGSQMTTFSGPRKYFHGNKVNIVLSAVPSYWTKAYCNMFEFEGLEPICFFGNEIKVNGYWNASSLYKLCVFGVTTATGTNDYSNWLSDIYDNDFFLKNSYNTSNSNYQPSFINHGNGYNFILVNCRDNRYHFPSYARASSDLMYNALAGGSSPIQSPQLTVGNENTTAPNPGSNDAFLFGNEILGS